MIYFYILIGVFLLNLYIWAYRISARRKSDRVLLNDLLEQQKRVQKNVETLIATQQLLIENLSNVKNELSGTESDLSSIKDKVKKLTAPRMLRPGFIGQDSVPFNYGR